MQNINCYLLLLSFVFILKLNSFVLSAANNATTTPVAVTSSAKPLQASNKSSNSSSLVPMPSFGKTFKCAEQRLVLQCINLSKHNAPDLFASKWNALNCCKRMKACSMKATCQLFKSPKNGLCQFDSQAVKDCDNQLKLRSKDAERSKLISFKDSQTTKHDYKDIHSTISKLNNCLRGFISLMGDAYCCKQYDVCYKQVPAKSILNCNSIDSIKNNSTINKANKLTVAPNIGKINTTSIPAKHYSSVATTNSTLSANKTLNSDKQSKQLPSIKQKLERNDKNKTSNANDEKVDGFDIGKSSVTKSKDKIKLENIKADKADKKDNKQNKAQGKDEKKSTTPTSAANINKHSNDYDNDDYSK